MNTEFYLIIAAILFNFLIFVSINERMKNINFRHKFMEENVNQMYNQLLDEIKERYKSQKVYEDYILLFQLYCNEDWDRNNPFREEIDCLTHHYFSTGQAYINIVPLETYVKDVFLLENKYSGVGFSDTIREKALKEIKDILKEDFDMVQNLHFGQLMMFLADLKSYNKEECGKSPKEYHKWRLESYSLKGDKSFERTIDEWDLASDEMKVLESTYLIGFFLKAMRRLNSGYISLEEANSDKYIEILESFKEIKKFIAQKINDKTTNDEVKSSIKKYFK